MHVLKIEPPFFGIVGFAISEEVVSLDGKASGKS
jgi:hypothetical protein